MQLSGSPRTQLLRTRAFKLHSNGFACPPNSSGYWHHRRVTADRTSAKHHCVSQSTAAPGVLLVMIAVAYIDTVSDTTTESQRDYARHPKTLKASHSPLSRHKDLHSFSSMTSRQFMYDKDKALQLSSPAPTRLRQSFIKIIRNAGPLHRASPSRLGQYSAMVLLTRRAVTPHSHTMI